ncbi:MAG: ribonuclease D [Hyphomicrobiales bacterium]|nr:ribonuclease D [Hyphomicrobiales bacterium]
MPVITDSAELKKRITPLMKETFVTVDTEFVREKVYYPQLCLIQLGGSEDAFAVDPMAKGLDMEPLIKLLRNKKVLKVFHAAQQDLEVFFNLMGKLPTPIFDTQLAALVLGHGEAPSYAKLVKEICHKQLDKSSRFTDWSKRPLTEKQVEYAISDVTYLRKIYERFSKLLQDKNREHWLIEEIESMTDTKQYELKADDAWERLKTKKHLTNEQQSCIRALAAWRETRAQKQNTPRSWVMKDDLLLEIAETMPETMADLEHMRRLSSNMVKSFGEEIIATVKKARRRKLTDLLPSLPRRSTPKANESLVTLLKVLLKMRCEKEKVAQRVVARTEDLERIAAMNNPDVPAMKGWRYEVFGRYALALKNGTLALAADGNKIVLLQQHDEAPR